MLAGGQLMVALAVLTAVQWGWLAKQGWSALRANRIQWPSVMLLGPGGFVLAAALVLAGLGALAIAGEVVLQARTMAIALASMALFTTLIAVPPVEWPLAFPLVNIHNFSYVAMLCSWLVGVATSIRVEGLRSSAGRLSLSVVGMFCGGLGLALFPATGQASRYLIISAMLIWFVGFAALAKKCLPHARSHSPEGRYQAESSNH
ncbi:MAG: hypothetical protein WAS02_00625 [Propionicimonas sp.]